jgi:MFS family permease
MPQYFRSVLHLPLATSGVAAACPYLAGYCGVLFWGYLSDRWVSQQQEQKRKWRLLTIRKVMNAIGLVGGAFFLSLMCRYATSMTSAVILLSLTLFFARAATLGYWVNMLDIGPSCAGHVHNNHVTASFLFNRSCL